MSAARDWRIESRQFVLAKEGATADECEDAVGVNTEARAYAVTDGATEAFDARRWARRLADEWVREAPLCAAEFERWVAAQGAWLHAGWEGRALPWYAEEKRRAGSFAALVGLRFEASGDPLRWRALALGDACLVQLRGEALVAALPLSSRAEFDSCPPLVPSSESWRATALARLVTGAGAVAAGDPFFLLTDAVAAWFFETRERDAARLAMFDSLAAAGDDGGLAELLRKERRAGRLRDDDVAVLRLAALRA